MEVTKTFDHEIIARLNKDVQDVHVELYPEYFKAYDFDSINSFFKNIINNPNYVFLILQDDDQCLGYAWIEIREYPESTFTKALKSIFIHQLSINKNQRNKGLGSLLINKIHEIGREKGIHKIQLDYWIDNEMAKYFYKKNGYVAYREFVFIDLD